MTATFFMTGNFARTYPAVAREIAADGFCIGNHTMATRRCRGPPTPPRVIRKLRARGYSFVTLDALLG